MNTNNNVYTVVYTTVIVVAVAAILAVVSQSLKSRQEANEKAETISQMLTAAGFGTKAEFEKMGNAAVIAKYKEEIDEAYTVDLEGKQVDSLSIEDAEIYTPAMLKKQNYILRGKQDGQVSIPVFGFKNGIAVVPVYGAGLWGPIWGYIALQNSEGQVSIAGAYFDHESETAGLGSKIKDDPAFQAKFIGEVPAWDSDNVFDIVKGGSPKEADGDEILDNKIDAISGATMTSQGLDKAIDTWLGAYSKHVQAGLAVAEFFEMLSEHAIDDETNEQED